MSSVDENKISKKCVLVGNIDKITKIKLNNRSYEQKTKFTCEQRGWKFIWKLTEHFIEI